MTSNYFMRLILLFATLYALVFCCTRSREIVEIKMEQEPIRDGMQTQFRMNICQ